MSALPFVARVLAVLLLASCSGSPPRSPVGEGRSASLPVVPALSPPASVPAPAPLASPRPPAGAVPERLAKGWLGVELAPPGTVGGASVTGVFPGSPAERAGLAPGDIVTAVDGTPVLEPRDLSKAIASKRAGDPVRLTYTRQDVVNEQEVVLAGMPRGETLTRMALLDQPAPDWTGLSAVTDGAETSLDAYSGKVVVLEFVAPWCAACQALTPTLNRWQERYRQQGVEILAVIAASEAEAKRTVSRFGIQYPVANDTAGRTVAAYRAFAVPTLLLLDQNQIVREVVVGLDREGIRRLETRLKQLSSGGM